MRGQNEQTSGGNLELMLTTPKEGHLTAFDVVRQIGEDGKPGTTTLEVKRRQLQPEPPEPPTRRESKARAHEFHAVDGFVDYLLKFGSPTTVVLADAGKRCVEAVLEESAKNGREVVTMRPQVHPRWKPWRNLLGAQVPILEFGDFLRDNARAIVSPEVPELTLCFAQIRMSKRVEVFRGKTTGGRSALNGVLVTTEVQGGSGSEESFQELPDHLVVRTPVMVDEPEQDIRLDIIVGTRGDEVVVKIASADIHEAEIAAFDALVATLREKLLYDGSPHAQTVHLSDRDLARETARAFLAYVEAC